MAKIYCKRIAAGQMKLSDVPEKWRAETAKLMEAGYEQQ